MSPLLKTPFAFACFARAAVLAAAVASSAFVAVGQDSFPGVRHSRDPRPERELIFFPPLPPPLDAPEPSAPRASIPPSPPAELAEHAGEIFYPQLGSRLRGNNLSDRQRQALASYRATKLALQNELRLELARLREADPATRRQALQALARRQAAPLAALEQSAEALRADLGKAEQEWGYHRQWRLGDDERRGFSPREIARVFRAFAFYEKRLSVTHRDLLCEIAHEVRLAAEDPKVAAAADPHVFFSPSPARVRWRDDAPIELAKKFAAYQSKKAELKKELYDAAYRHDGRALLLSHPLGETAAKQTARLAQLEELAEEIRVELAALPSPRAPTPPSPIPPTLAESIAALQRQRAALLREAHSKIEAVSERTPKGAKIKITLSFEPDGLKFIVVPTAAPSPELTRLVQEVGGAISAIADDYGRGLAEIANAEEELRGEIAAFTGDKRPQAVDAAWTASIRAHDARRHVDAYGDYRAAVFEPGLSLEQRRLLLDHAIVQLDLPLPRGELQPTRRSDSW